MMIRHLEHREGNQHTWYSLRYYATRYGASIHVRHRVAINLYTTDIPIKSVSGRVETAHGRRLMTRFRTLST